MASREAVVRSQITPEAQAQIRDALAQLRKVVRDFVSTISGQLRPLRVPSELTEKTDQGGHMQLYQGKPMQYGDPDFDWTEWVAANEDRDEDTKLLALREYIYAEFLAHTGTNNITREWSNKKLTKLGIAERIPGVNTYVIQAPAMGVVSTPIVAATREDAEREFRHWIDARAGTLPIQHAVLNGAPSFTTGPEDADTAVSTDAPTTVADLLDAFREVVLLGHIAGPKYCQPGADDVLRRFGLAPIPAKAKFRVTRPVEAVAVTEVEAYDEGSATRVAGWRWEELGRPAYTFESVEVTGIPTVE